MPRLQISQHNGCFLYHSIDFGHPLNGKHKWFIRIKNLAFKMAIKSHFSNFNCMKMIKQNSLFGGNKQVIFIRENYPDFLSNFCLLSKYIMEKQWHAEFPSLWKWDDCHYRDNGITKQKLKCSIWIYCLTELIGLSRMQELSSHPQYLLK